MKGSQNRKELVGVLFDLKKVRLAKMVASKIYYGYSGMSSVDETVQTYHTGFSWPH